MTEEESDNIKEIITRFSTALSYMSSAVRELADGMGCLCLNRDPKGKSLLNPVTFTDEVLTSARNLVTKAHEVLEPKTPTKK